LGWGVVERGRGFHGVNREREREREIIEPVVADTDWIGHCGNATTLDGVAI